MWFVTGKADPQVMGTVAQAPKGIPSLIVRGNTRSGISEYHRSSCHRHTATVSDRAGDYAPVALRPDHLSLVLPGTRNAPPLTGNNYCQKHKYKHENRNFSHHFSSFLNKHRLNQGCSDKPEMITLFPYAGIIRIRF